MYIFFVIDIVTVYFLVFFLALTVRFLTKRFIGEYQSIMRKYISSAESNLSILNIVIVLAPYSHNDNSR